MEQRHESPTFLVNRALVIVDSERMVEQDLEQFRQYTGTKEDSDALDGPGSEEIHLGEKSQQLDAPRRRLNVNRSIETPLREGP